MSRYDLGKEDDAAFEPGSGETVLRNRLQIVDSHEADLMEASLLAVAQTRALLEIESDAVLDFSILTSLHRSWLAPLYDFAGEIRRVNVSKGGIMFAPVQNLAAEIDKLDAILKSGTPCEGLSLDEVVPILAHVHGEFILVHPFREGNGRLGRWLADIMALQAGLPPLEWGFDKSTEKQTRYFDAMHRSFAMDFSPLQALMREALERALS